MGVVPIGAHHRQFGFTNLVPLTCMMGMPSCAVGASSSPAEEELLEFCCGIRRAEMRDRQTLMARDTRKDMIKLICQPMTDVYGLVTGSHGKPP